MDGHQGTELFVYLDLLNMDLNHMNISAGRYPLTKTTEIVSYITIIDSISSKAPVAVQFEALHGVQER